MTPTNTALNQSNSQPHPIPNPRTPKQYRAIGIIRGKYQPWEKVLTKGTIISSSGQNIDAVLLGKAITVVKNHVNLNQNQYWIVYPHTAFDQNNSLHAQIVGVWQPNSSNDDQVTFPDDYFSIRGEVIYSSRREEKVIVKIYANNSLNRNRPSFFKLQLQGKIPDHTIKHFYDFAVILKGDQLVIKQYIDLGLIAVRYSRFKTIKNKDPVKNIITKKKYYQ